MKALEDYTNAELIEEVVKRCNNKCNCCDMPIVSGNIKEDYRNIRLRVTCGYPHCISAFENIPLPDLTYDK